MSTELASPTVLPRPAYLDLIDEHHSVARSHRRRAYAMLLVPAVAGLAFGVLVTIAIAPVWSALVVGGAVAAFLAVLARRAAPGIVLRRVGAHAVDLPDAVRVGNMLDELSLTVGVKRPPVYVVELDAVEVMVVGTEPRHSSLVVTQGLIEHLDVMQTEALLAHALIRLKDQVMAPATVAVTALVPLAQILPPVGRSLWRRLGTERPELTDFRTVRVTHYPPGLIGAFAAMEEHNSSKVEELPGGESVGHLWTAPPSRCALAGTAGANLALRRAILEQL